MVTNLKIPKRLVSGITSKLDFDYSCNRGHAFGESHVHGVINEILNSNIDPTKYTVVCGHNHKLIQKTTPERGRPREVDFSIIEKNAQKCIFSAEVKWAGSSHCTPERILVDLIRLQIIANSKDSTECTMIISGHKKDISDLFSKPLFDVNTERLLIFPESAAPNGRGDGRSKKFNLTNNRDHLDLINDILGEAGARDYVGGLPNKILTDLVHQEISRTKDGRFQTYAWKVRRIK